MSHPEPTIDDYKLRVLELEDALFEIRRVRDSAQAASNRNLEEKRTAEAHLKQTRTALAFAASVIRCGEGWTSTCDEYIGGALAL